MNQAMNQGAYVVILHGILLSDYHMRSLEHYIASHHYDVIVIKYPSTKENLETLVKFIRDKLIETIGTETTRPIHFVGFSMGGLLVRALLNQYRPSSLGRVVLLATPNKGSELADWLKDFWLYQKLYGPAGQQLTTDQPAKSLLGTIDYPCGAIAGRYALGTLESVMTIKKQNDGKVSVDSATVGGLIDHIIINENHTLFPFNKQVQYQTVYFLKHGKFENSDKKY